MSSIARKLSSFALSSAEFFVGVFARVDPRLRALPNGPLSSGIRVRLLYSVLLAIGQHLILIVTRLMSIRNAICTHIDRLCARLLLHCISSLYLAPGIAYLLGELKAPWQPSPLRVVGAL
jgi:hypothetical protein